MIARHFGDPYAGVTDPYLHRACQLAERGRGTTSPNPTVGCVLVRDSVVVGEGWHQRWGGPHAEVEALSEAGADARGATAYVTLEPCAHTGRTGPCAEALIAAGVSRVVIGLPDPTPVAAGGAELLRRAGVDVEFAADAAPFEDLLREWLHRQRTGRPFVRVKIALSLDGRPGIEAGRRTALTGEAARDFTMLLRSHADAVMVGTSTVAVDDPSLTVRAADGTPAERQPLRVVFSRTEQPSGHAHLFSDGLGPTGVLIPDALEAEPDLAASGARMLPYDLSAGIDGALAALAAAHVVSLLVETGPRLFSALMAAGRIDELIVLHAGGFAGERAPALWLGPAQEDAETLIRPFRAIEAAVVGDDAATVWRPREPVE